MATLGLLPAVTTHCRSLNEREGKRLPAGTRSGVPHHGWMAGRLGSATALQPQTKLTSRTQVHLDAHNNHASNAREALTGSGQKSRKVKCRSRNGKTDWDEAGSSKHAAGTGFWRPGSSGAAAVFTYEEGGALSTTGYAQAEAHARANPQC